jgi:methyltransferase (TIGR00027 family)
MQDETPSRTALRVAIRRAAHQLFDTPRVFEDSLALRIIGADRAAALAASPDEHRGRLARAFRAFMAVRSRFAEDELARAVGRGATQCVVLGAGLDTFACRNPHPNLRVFEVDHPATQQWKRRMLADAAIEVPASLTFVPVDFSTGSLSSGLALANFDAERVTFFSWLGVTMYLPAEAVSGTLALVAATPPGGGVVFDYAVPRSSLGITSRLALDALSRRVTAAGEPFLTHLDPGSLRAQLAALGFSSVVDLGADEINARYFSGRADDLRVGGDIGRLMSAGL